MRDWNKEERNFIYRTVILLFFSVGIVYFSYSFQILYLYNTFGILEAGMYLLVLQITKFLLDYITGNLGDYIGQRGVMILAFFSHGVGFALFVIARSQIILLGIAVINGFASAQFSGCFNAWFDNNYRFIAQNHDKNFETYPLLLVKISAISSINRFVFMIAGGVVALLFSRVDALFGEAILSFFGMILAYLFMYDFQDVSSVLKEQKNSFVQNFTQGLQFMFLSKYNFLLLFTRSLINMEAYMYTAVWIIPLYSLYLKNDLNISIFNGIEIIIVMIIQLFFINKIAKRITNIDNLSYLFITATLINFFIPVFFKLSNPSDSNLNIMFIVVLMIIIVSLSIFATIGNIYLLRKIQKIVPSSIRTSVYSLLSTVSTIMIIVLLPVFIFVLDKYSLFDVILLDVVIYLICVLFTLLIFKIENTDRSYVSSIST